MNETRRVVIATGNPHKIEEISAILGPDSASLGLSFVGLDAFPEHAEPEPVEDADTFEGNAAIKAVEYARRTGCWCLADDSGLVVDALEGAPGVLSARYAAEGYDGFGELPRADRDARNNAKLLAALEGVAPEARTARFVCAMVLAGPGIDGGASVMASVRGTFEGRIGEPPRVPSGEHGFGYDPLFLVAEPGAGREPFSVASAELPPEQKNRLSHRAAACRLMSRKLQGIPT
ncbi:MAG: non-canonical purine NTP pyrophosphatase [Planctomycetota bacterium]